MASTYSTNLALELIGTGEQSGTWGTTTNTNLGTLLEQAISGYVTQAITDGSGANTTITIPNGTTGVARNMFIEMTGALSFSTTSLIVPANKKMYFVFNNTSGGFAVTVKVSGQTGILVPNGKKVILTCNGTDIVEAHTAIVGNATIGGTLGVTGTLSGGTSGTGYSFSGSAPATSLTLDASGNLGIGTSSPAYRLDSRVTTSASVVSAINLDASGNSNGDGSAVNFSRAGNALSGVARISAVKAEVSNNETDLVFSNFAAGSLTEKMRIVGATGNVGIGTSSPVGKLNVIGGLGVGVALTGDQAVTPPSGSLILAGTNLATEQTYTSPGVSTTIGQIYNYASIANSFARYLDIVAYGSTSGAGSNIRLFTSNGATNTERARFNSTGAFIFAGGTTTADGIGITFPATQSASTNANTLDDYEEGTWTPNQGSGLTVVGTFSSAGIYTKVGRLVTIRGIVFGSTSVSASSAGQISIYLPFTPESDTAGSYFNGSLSTGGQIDAAPTGVFAVGAIAATTGIYFSATYAV